MMGQLQRFQTLQANTPAHLALADGCEVLTDVYRSETQLVIWRRAAPLDTGALAPLLATSAEWRVLLKPQEVAAYFQRTLPDFAAREQLAEDVALLADMYACLFDLQQVGVRLSVLNRTMCPRFHADRVLCRLLTTYTGAGTEYISTGEPTASILERCRNRDDASDQAMYLPVSELACGDVALCKGSQWPGNERHALVHRSPSPGETPRLLLSMDAA